MRRTFAYALLSLSVVYCQSSGDDATGTGGSSNTGGASATGSGGSSAGNDASASGGSAQGGSGGTTGTGGTTGSGGTTGGGGSAGAGRDAGSAGSGGSGAAGSGGSTGIAGGPRDAAVNDVGAADARADVGGGTGTGDARSDAPVAYNPCPPAGQACRIMPLGDSITDGFITNPNELGGYRIELFRAAHSAGKTITFVGSQSNGPGMVDGVPFPMMHEGHSGFTIDNEPAPINRMGISDPLITDAGIANFRPHIVLLFIGTNDINLDVDQGMPANADVRLGALMDKIFTDDPNLLLVLGKIVPTRTDATNTRVQAYNAGMNALVQTRATAGKHVMLVDMYAAFTADPNYKTTLLFDDLHPTIAGYTTMGQVWYQAISSLLR